MIDSEFHARRKEGIGSTDSAAILGLSPWKSPHDVWMAKVGEGDEEVSEPNLPQWLGLKLQDAIGELYTKQTGQPVVADPNQYAHEPRNILRAHVDFRWSLGPSGPIVEIKTASHKKGWGEAGTADVPKHYWIQVQQQMACLPEVPFADVAVLFGHNDFRVYHVPRDQTFIDSLIADMEEWWDLYVETKTPPPLDGSEGASKMLRRRYPDDDGTIIPATADHSALVTALMDIRETKAAIERAEELYVQQLKDAIGQAQGIQGPGWHISWKNNKPGQWTDWKAVTKDLAHYGEVPDSVYDESIHTNTKDKKGSRPFIVTVEEQE